jgi:hypothetical protein
MATIHNKRFLALFFVVLSLLSMANFHPVKAALITVTRTFIASSNDGYLAWYDTNYTLVHNAVSGILVNSTTGLDIGQRPPISYITYRSFLFFDTSILGGNVTIVSANLSLYVSSDHSTTDFNVTIQTNLGKRPHMPLEESDYYYNFYDPPGPMGSRSTSTITGVGYWNISLSAWALGFIYTDDYTKLVLRSQEDIDSSAPTTDEYVVAYGREQGEAYAPKLYVTYQTEGYNYVVHGPYNENGNVANAFVNLTMSIENMPKQTYGLNGSDASADTLNIQVEQRGLMFSWNISNPDTNKTRIYILTDATFEELYIFVPDPDEPYYLYSVNINDLAGIKDAYMETLVYVDGVNRVVERQNASSINAIPFWFTWAHHYNLRLGCDLGTYVWNDFIPLTDASQTLIVTRSMFPINQFGFGVNVYCARQNDTWVQMNYSDADEETIWVYVLVKHRSGSGYATDTSDNTTGNNVQFNWYSADSVTSYYVDIISLKNGHQYNWTLTAPQPSPTEDVWGNSLDIFGTFPIPSRYVIGIGIILCVFAVFSSANLGLGCFLGTLTATMLTYFRWLNISWVLLGSAMILSIIIIIWEGKRKEVYF